VSLRQGVGSAPGCLGLVGISACCCFWQLVASFAVVVRFFLPSPAEVLASGAEQLNEGSWSTMPWRALGRVLGAMPSSILVSLPLAFARAATGFVPLPAAGAPAGSDSLQCGTGLHPAVDHLFGLGELPKCC